MHILLGISLTMSSFNRRCYRCCISCLCNLSSERLPALLTIRLFGCLACVWGFVCRLSKYFSSVHSDVIVCAGDIRLLFKLLLQFRNVLNIPRAEAPLLAVKISNMTSQQRWRFSFALKPNETTYMKQPCIRLADGKFDLTNQDSAGGKKYCPHLNVG